MFWWMWCGFGGMLMVQVLYSCDVFIMDVSKRFVRSVEIFCQIFLCMELQVLMNWQLCVVKFILCLVLVQQYCVFYSSLSIFGIVDMYGMILLFIIYVLIDFELV